MVKSNKAGKKLKNILSVKLEQEVELPTEPRILNETDAIYFWTDLKRRSETQVPPCTPQSIANLTILPNSFPDNFPTLDSLNIPYVRETGVKKCMQILGEYLGCTNYTYDYLQFWFLDILIDCLWKTQDEYYLNENNQKKVLEWIIYIFKILTDIRVCYSRKRFFKLFKEMILMAGDVLNETDCEIPTPQKLFTLMSQEEETAEEDEKDNEEEIMEEEKSRTSTLMSSSTISISTYKSIDIIDMEVADQKKSFTIKRKRCWCHHDDISLDEYDLPTSLSSNITIADDIPKLLSDNETHARETVEQLQEEIVIDAENNLSSYLQPFSNRNFRKFYQPDSNIPKRFLPLSRSSDDKEETSTERNVSVFSDDGGDFEGYKAELESEYKKHILPNISADIEKKEEEMQVDEALIKKEIHKFSRYSPMRKSKVSNHSSRKSVSENSKLFPRKISRLRSRENPASKLTVRVSMAESTDEQIMKRLQNYKLWEKRLQDMDDPKTGWMPEPEEVLQEATTNTDEEDWEDLVETDTTSNSEKNNRNLYFNLGVLCAIIDFVFDYFYRNFHFTLIKLAVKTIPSVITQKLSTQWKVPKVIKQEFHRPKLEKKKKEKKPKKEKKSTKSKSTKSKSSKSSKASKKSKKDKTKKSSKGSKKGSAKSKSDKKTKSKKPIKLTKEQRTELERQKKLQEEYEAEQRRLEENKKFMFPLTDAATDDFFRNIFEGWQKPKEHGKKEKKDKKKRKK